MKSEEKYTEEKEYARKLYSIRDGEKRKYSLDNIAVAVSYKTGKKLTKSMLHRWVHAEKWDETCLYVPPEFASDIDFLFQHKESKRVKKKTIKNVVDSLEDINKKYPSDPAVLKHNVILHKMAFEVLNAKEDFDVKDAIQILRITNDFFKAQALIDARTTNNNLNSENNSKEIHISFHEIAPRKVTREQIEEIESQQDPS